jgi:hypothetical protein
LISSAFGYGLSKLCSSGGKEDIKRNILTENIKTKLFKESKRCEDAYNENLTLFIEQLQLAVKSDKITINKSEKLKELVLNGKFSIEMAITRLNSLNSI